MAIKKAKKDLKEKITLGLRIPKYAGFQDCFLQTPAIIQIRSGLPENVELTVRLFDGNNLLIPFETAVTVPFESSV